MAATNKKEPSLYNYIIVPRVYGTKKLASQMITYVFKRKRAKPQKWKR